MQYCLSIFFFILIGIAPVIAQQDSAKLNQSVSRNNQVDTTSKQRLIISEIQIVGNKRTKPYIILREMTLKVGDIITASDLPKQIEKSKNQVFNTSLFIETNITTSSKTGDVVTLKVEVKERWYLFPVPYFTLADRNFNQWWVIQHRDFNRVNYGIQATQYNLTGNNDPLSIWLINGYNKQISLRYTVPFFNNSLKHGFDIGYSYITQKEVTDSTDFNKQAFIKSNSYVFTYNRADISYTFRPDQYWRHSFRVGFTHQRIGDTVLLVKQNYFPNKSTQFQFVDFTYRFRYQNFDYNAYPTKGSSLEGYIYERGLDDKSNLWQLGFGGMYVRPMFSKTYLKFAATGTFKTPSNNYFINQPLFGYTSSSNLRGLEYYVIDGDAGVLAQSTLFREIYSCKVKTHLKSKNYSQIPFRFFFKVFADVGYAHNDYPGNSMLNNQLLYTGGFGLDIVSFYDLAFRLEFSFNQLGQHGLFLHVH